MAELNRIENEEKESASMIPLDGRVL
jgi:hypothetical protein